LQVPGTVTPLLPVTPVPLRRLARQEGRAQKV
jgi:hypothetical protein